MLNFLIPGISALAGLFGNRGGTATTNQSQQSQGWNSSQGEQRPIYDDQQSASRDLLFNTLRNRIMQNMDMRGFSAQGLQNVNRGMDAQRGNLASSLAARGLGGSPIAAAMMGNLEGQRTGQQANFLNTVPQIQRQWQGEDITSLLNLFRSMPFGQTSQSQNQFSQNSNSQTTAKGPSNMLGGLLSGLGAGLGATPWALGEQGKALQGLYGGQAPVQSPYGNIQLPGINPALYGLLGIPRPANSPWNTLPGPVGRP